jgi:hypothetical protein
VVINKPARLSVSEPRPNSTDDYPAYEITSPPETSHYDPPKDTPFDYAARGRPARIALAVKTQGTTPNVAVVHLQRLADPTRAYNGTTTSADYNPYRTIDTSAIDLTAFNGWDGSDALLPAGATPGTMKFAARERGEGNVPAVDSQNNLWVSHPDYLKTPTTPDTPATDAKLPYFSYTLTHTLGYLNTAFTTFDTTQTPPTPNRIASGANRGDPDTSKASTYAFPWLTWNNRPFVSPMELLLVPQATSARLLNAALATTGNPTSYFGVDNPAGPNNPYTTATAEVGSFRHTMNFFYSSPLANSDTSSRLYQLMDYLGVPSPFVGTEVQPTDVGALANTGGVGNQHFLYPPFNLAAIYREPGRINLNTIFSPDVWDGLMNYYPGLARNSKYSALPGVFNDFAVSRRGYTGGTWSDATNASYPSRFANPFRSSAGAGLNPVPPPTLTGAEVNATVMRPDPNATYSALPLLGFDGTRFSGAVGDCNDPSRNPFFRYQSLARLSNLATTRSNVYAVWITVGYFDVVAPPTNRVHKDGSAWTAAEYAAVYPDGLALGKEHGADTGEIKRHRSFYLIDRSIPAAFVRGQDWNTGSTIRLMRNIE